MTDPLDPRFSFTHLVAISDARIHSFDGDTATLCFRKPVSKSGAKPSYGTITQPNDAFIPRFRLHRIPKRFQAISQETSHPPRSPADRFSAWSRSSAPATNGRGKSLGPLSRTVHPWTAQICPICP